MKTRAAVTILLIVMAVLSPMLIMSDADPEWRPPQLRYITALCSGICFLTLAVVYAVVCISAEGRRKDE